MLVADVSMVGTSTGSIIFKDHVFVVRAFLCCNKMDLLVLGIEKLAACWYRNAEQKQTCLSFMLDSV